MKKSNEHLINKVLEKFNAGEKASEKFAPRTESAEVHFTFGGKNTAYRNQRNPKNLLQITTYQN